MSNVVSVSALPPVNGSDNHSNTNNNNSDENNSSSASLFGSQSSASVISSEDRDDAEVEVENQTNHLPLPPDVIAINDNTVDDNDGEDDDVAEVIDLTAEDPAAAGQLLQLPPPLPPLLPIVLDDLDDIELDDFQPMENGLQARRNASRMLRRQQQQREAANSANPELSEPEATTVVRAIKKRRLSDGEGGGASCSSSAAASSAAPQPADEGCTICFEPWTSAGEHRVCALRCGHLFGRSCVERWLETRQQCPQCNRNTRRHEVVPLYVSNLRALDNGETEALKAEVDRVKRAKLAAEQEAGDMRLRLGMLREENRKLSKQLEFYRSQSSKLTIDLTDSTAEVCCYRLEDNVAVSHVGECRVLALNQQLNVLCISQPSRNPLFRGYGLRKLDLVDFRNSSYIHLHTNKLRDVCFNPEGTMLLSAGMDKQVRLTGFHSEQTVCHFDCPAAVWSCAWSPFDANQFYAGLGNGRVMCFDMRHTGSHVSVLPCAEDPPSVTSVLALASLPANLNDGIAPATLLAGQFDRLSLYRRPSASDTSAAAAAATTDDLLATLLPMPGPAGGQQLAWLATDPASRHVLLTHRPTVNHHQQQPQLQQQRSSGVEHSVCSLDFVRSEAATAQPSAEAALRPLSRIRAGQSMKLLARSRLYQQASRSGGALTVAAGDEATCRLNLWDAATGDKLQSLARLPHPVLDIAPVRGGRFLACLTEQSLYVYKDIKAE